MIIHFLVPILKANRLGADTKDLDKTFQDYLDTANLKPKQNNLDALSDAQTYPEDIDNHHLKTLYQKTLQFLTLFFYHPLYLHTFQ